MAEAMMMKRALGLFPATDHDKDTFSKIPQNEVLRVKWTRPRNVLFHRKFWALARVAFDHSEHPSVEAFVDDLKIMVGHCDRIVRMDGSIWLRPRSISFANMDDDEFATFYDGCVNIILEHVLVGVSYEELERIVARFM